MVNSRKKGRAGEKAAVDAMKSLGFKRAKSDGFQFRGGDERPDLFVSEDLWVEVKNRGVTNVKEALFQALADKSPESIPVALHKVPGRGAKTGKEWILSIFLEDIEQLSRAILVELGG